MGENMFGITSHQIKAVAARAEAINKAKSKQPQREINMQDGIDSAIKHITKLILESGYLYHAEILSFSSAISNLCDSKLKLKEFGPSTENKTDIKALTRDMSEEDAAIAYARMCKGGEE